MAGVMLVAASVATLASAQPGGGGFGMMGGGMMGGNVSITQLLTMAAVQTELKLTDDQKSKVQELQQTMRDKMQEAMNAAGGPPDFSDPQAMQKQIADMRKKMAPIIKDIDGQAVKLLTSDQVDRVKQLQLQRQGANALTRDEVAKKLGLKDDQVDKIKKLQATLTQPPQFDPNGDARRNSKDAQRPDQGPERHARGADRRADGHLERDAGQAVHVPGAWPRRFRWTWRRWTRRRKLV